MLIDARKFANGQRIEADICLIGAGAAGIALARELVKDQERVVLLESGGFEYDPQIQALYEGETTGPRYMPLNAARLRYFGGSTNHFGGASRILDPIDFEARDWLPGSGWPITHNEMAPFYTRAQDVFPVCPYGFATERWIHGTGFPLIGADSKRIATKIWQFNPVRFGTVYREELLSAANVTVCLHATVLGFAAERYGSRVKTLNCATPGGPRFTVASKTFILCCGGIENARVLLIAKEERALNIDRGGVLGRYFMDHLVINNAAQFAPLRRGPTPRDLYVPSGLNGHWFRGVLSVQEELARAEQLQSVAFFIDQQELPTGRAALAEIWSSLAQGSLPERPGDALGRVFGYVDDRIDQAYREAFHTKSGIFNELHAFEPSSIFAFLEQAPNRDSRVSLSEVKDSLGQRRVHLNWRLSRSDKRSLLRSLEIVGAELARLGVARIRINLSADLDQWPDDLTTYCHHMGTTRMDREALHGVVDENCRVHGVQSLRRRQLGLPKRRIRGADLDHRRACAAAGRSLEAGGIMNLHYPTRRRVVLRAILLGAGAAISARGFAFAVRGAAVVSRRLAESATQCVLADPHVTELGACYLGDEAGEASVPHLLARIGERWPAGATDLERLPHQSLRRALASIALQDFERADVVLVDGWVLARSEARLYAVAHLVRS